MKSVKIISIFMMLNIIVYAQTEISGSVIIGNKCEPLANCNIFIKDTEIGTVTNNDGCFSLLTDFEGEYILQVSHIGYNIVERAINTTKGKNINLNIKLQSNILDGDLISVTVTKTARRLYEIPGRLEVITNNYLTKLPAQNLDDILQYVSGLNVHRTSGIFEIRPVVSLRGVSGDEAGRTLILVDGVPINKSDTGVANWNRIDVNNIDQVEIFKGAGSSLYGNNAMGGTINIITKRPTQKFTGNLSLSRGTYNTKNMNVSASKYVFDKLFLNLAGFYRNSSGYFDLPDSLQDQYSVPLFLDERGISANIGYNFNKNTIFNIKYDYYDDKRGEGVKINKDNGKHRQFDTNFIQATLLKNNNKSKYEINGFVQKENYLRVDEGFKKDVYSHFDVLSERIDKGLLFNYSLNISTSNSLTFGAEIKSGSVDGGDYYTTSPDTVLNKGMLSIFASYLQYEFGLMKNRLRVISSVRIDNVKFHDGLFSANVENNPFYNYSGDIVENNWNSLSPRVALRYNSENHISFYSSYTRGFRSATLDDLCRTGWMRLGPKLANPELGPETIDNYEIGLDYSPYPSMKISPTIYYSQGKEFLYYINTGELLWGSRPIYKRENVTEVNIKGAECDVVFKPNDVFSILCNYTYNNSIITSFTENPELEGKYLVYSPLNQIKSVFQFTTNLVNVNFGALYKDKQFTNDDNSEQIEGYLTYNCQLSKELFNSIKLSVEIQNVTDIRITEHPERLSPGRMTNINLSYKW